MAWPFYPWTHFSYGDPHKTCTRSSQHASRHPTEAALVGLSGLRKQGEELKASNVEAAADTQDYRSLLGASHKPQVVFRTHCSKPGFPHPRISSQTSGKYICQLILRNGTETPDEEMHRKKHRGGEGELPVLSRHASLPDSMRLAILKLPKPFWVFMEISSYNFSLLHFQVDQLSRSIILLVNGPLPCIWSHYLNLLACLSDLIKQRTPDVNHKIQF